MRFHYTQVPATNSPNDQENRVARARFFAAAGFEAEFGPRSQRTTSVLGENRGRAVQVSDQAVRRACAEPNPSSSLVDRIATAVERSPKRRVGVTDERLLLGEFLHHQVRFFSLVALF